MIELKILKKSKRSAARLGILKTPHGEVETPALVPVATRAVVKTLTTDEVRRAGYSLLIANTFHLHFRPGEAVVKKAGGLHKFMNWKGGLMTDSAGFQVFSLGFGRDFGTGKIALEKSDRKITVNEKPRGIKIMEDGVVFRSPVDGREVFLGPKESIKIQEALGADIIFAFDECTSPLADYEYTKTSLLKTHRWAEICLKSQKSRQALYGIVQGGKFKDLRKESARRIAGLDFPGFGIGGEFGDDKKKMVEMVRWVVEELPEKKPRHLLGIGSPKDIRPIIEAGVDAFDCTIPTHYARHGTAFVSSGKLDLGKTRFLKEQKALDKNCRCEVCQTYSRSYLSHLIRAQEITGLRLLTFHNLFFFNQLVESARKDIKKGKI